MGKKQKIAYWLLPACALCFTGAVLSVGHSQARYNNTAVWYTVAEPADFTVTSNYLEQTDQPPVTVLLGQMGLEPREFSVALSSATAVSGPLTWDVDKPEYLDVRVENREILLDHGDAVSLEGQTPEILTVTLTPTAKAAEPREAMNVNIQIGWSDALSGTFRVELSQVEEIAPPETTESETTGPETTEAETTEAEATESEVTEPEATESEVTEPETTEPETTEPETTEAEIIEPEVSEPLPVMAMEGCEVYHPELMFPLYISADRNIKTSLQIITEDGIQPFPQKTRFSLDQGASWFLLYQAGEIPLNVQAGESATVFLDLSDTDLAAEPGLTVTAGADTAYALTAITQPLFQMNSRVLTKDTQVQIAFARLWQDCELTCSVEMLVSTENGKTYVPAEVSSDTLITQLTTDGEKPQLDIQMGSTLPQPGTYRVNMRWQHQGICIWQGQTNFFINHTGNSITNQTGGDLQ